MLGGYNQSVWHYDLTMVTTCSNGYSWEIITAATSGWPWAIFTSNITPKTSSGNGLFDLVYHTMTIVSAWWFFATPLKKWMFVSWDDEIPNIWWFPEIGVPLVIIHFRGRDFSNKNHPAIWVPPFSETTIWKKKKHPKHLHQVFQPATRARSVNCMVHINRGMVSDFTWNWAGGFTTKSTENLWGIYGGLMMVNDD